MVRSVWWTKMEVETGRYNSERGRLFFDFNFNKNPNLLLLD